jgi:hypothetical protein
LGRGPGRSTASRYPVEATHCLMRHVETPEPIPPYAGRDTDASFQCNENLMYIYNSNGRLHAYVGWTIAAFLIVFPLVRVFVPGRRGSPSTNGERQDGSGS